MSIGSSLKKMIGRFVARFPYYPSRPLSTRPDIKARVEALLGRDLADCTIPDLGQARVAALSPFDRDNWLVFVGKRPRRSFSVIRIGKRRNNILVMGQGSQPVREIRFEGDGNLAVTGSDIRWNVTKIRFVSDDGLMVLGARSILNGTEFILEGNGKAILVGDEGLFAPGTVIRTSDLHAIVDMTSKEWINQAADVVLQSHIWLGQDALVLKGVTIGAGSVIGAKSLVTSNISSASVAGGVPAKVLRKDIQWYLERQPPDFSALQQG